MHLIVMFLLGFIAGLAVMTLLFATTKKQLQDRTDAACARADDFERRHYELIETVGQRLAQEKKLPGLDGEKI